MYLLNLIILLVIFSFPLFIPSAQAFRLVLKQLPERVQEAEAIVYAKLLETTPIASPTNKIYRLGFSQYRFEPIEIIKGWEAGKLIELRLLNTTSSPAPTLDSRGLDRMSSLENFPELNPGDEVILFLGPINASGRPTLKGYRQGLVKTNTKTLISTDLFLDELRSYL